MTITIDLAPEEEARLREAATKRGLAPQRYVAQALADALQREAEESVPLKEARPPADVDSAARTLDKLLAGRTGRVHFQPSDLSENVGEKFTEYLEEKRRQSRL